MKRAAEYARLKDKIDSFAYGLEQDCKVCGDHMHAAWPSDDICEDCHAKQLEALTGE